MKHSAKYWDAINFVKEFHGDGSYPDEKAVDGLFGMLCIISGIFDVDTDKILRDVNIDHRSLGKPSEVNDYFKRKMN